MKKPEKYKIISLTPDQSLCIIDDFLSAKECATLIKMAKKQGLETYDKAYKLGKKTPKNMEKVTLFERGATKTFKEIERKIAELTLIPIENGECSKIIHYQNGDYHEPHYDILYDRILTFLVYLCDVEEGGETTYPDLGIKVIPKKGRALLMYYSLGSGLPQKGDKTFPRDKKLYINEPGGFHGGGKIYKGEKWVLAKFFRSVPVEGSIEELIADANSYHRPIDFLQIPLQVRKSKK